MQHAIVVDQLYKKYRLGELQHNMLRDAFISGARRLIGRKPATPPDENHLWALNGISLEIKQGEIVGIIGRNGAGKSTLLKVLSRITFPTAGQVKVSGRVASLLEVGTGFHEELTGRENIYLNGSILGMTKREIETSMEQIVHFADIDGFLDTPIKRYSSGMRMRLGFSVAAHLNPDVLFVDEVLAVGDVSFQKKCLSSMRNLGSGGRTILFVSHNLAAVENLCNRAIWISNGKVQMDGDSREVIKAYLKDVSVSDQSGMDLTMVKTRSGTGQVRFTRLELCGPDGCEQHAVHSGDALSIKMYYECQRDIPHLNFGFRLFSNLGAKLTDLHTWGTGVDIPLTPVGPGEITLEIDFLNLMPGTYYLGIWAASIGGEWHDVLDHVMTLEVEPSDYFGSGRGIESRFGLLFFPCRWRVSERSAHSTANQPPGMVSSSSNRVLAMERNGR
jgi:lipopolysaccharide transport system ATP-binding protein